MCTANKATRSGAAAAPRRPEPAAEQPPAAAPLKPSPSASSLASSASSRSSASVASSVSTSFSDRDPDWYLDVVLGFAGAPTADAAPAPAADPVPSKAGGVPTWLYRGAPPPPPLPCRRCGAVLALLLQLYAPLPGVDAAFHRAVYLFVCRAPGCAGGDGSARALVAQLPRRNEFYAYDALGEVGEGATLGGGGGGGGAKVDEEARRVSCVLCGFAARSHCGRCKDEWYCSRGCQRIDWKLGHRRRCGAADGDASEDVEGARRSWRFKEFEIVNESCPTPGGGCSERGSDDGSGDEDDGAVGDTGAAGKTADATSSENMISAAMKAAGVAPSLQDVSSAELPRSLFSSPRRAREDSAFRRFSDMMGDAPDQLVRYWRGGRPLWAAKGGRPAGGAGACGRCGGPALFELQALPQLLHVLGVDAGGEAAVAARCGGLDFGTIAVFACAAACGEGAGGAGEFGYVEERAHVQRIEDGAAAAAAAATAAAASAAGETRGRDVARGRLAEAEAEG